MSADSTDKSGSTACRRGQPHVAFDPYIERALADWGKVSVAVSVVQGNEVIYSRGFGLKAVGESAEIGPDTLFQIGSTSKAFTTAALGILSDEGSIRWDDRVTDHLPEFALQDPWLTRHLTIRDTVTHRSGIVGTSNFVLSVMDGVETVRQLRYASAEAAYRDSYRYSNSMYAVAGQIVEAAARMPWSEFVRRRLLQPLKMHRSGTSPYDFWGAAHVVPTFLGAAPAGRPTLRDARDPDLAMPHGWDEQGAVVVLPWVSYDNAAAAGAIVSSASDMANWLILHLNEGCFEGNELLKKETLHELHATQNLHVDVNRFPFEGTQETYAMGWRRSEYRGTPHLAHGGAMTGFPAYAALLPDPKLGVVILSNGPEAARNSHTLHKSIAFWIFDRLLGAPTRDWSKEFLLRYQEEQGERQRAENRLSQARLRNAPPTLPIECYIGSYEDRNCESVRVEVGVSNGLLMLRFAGAGAFSADFQHWHGDLFRLRPCASTADLLGPCFATFTVGPAGTVTHLSLLDATFRRLRALQ
jgi:CubicO group peptidase (beta-lactamase class C family)